MTKPTARRSDGMNIIRAKIVVSWLLILALGLLLCLSWRYRLLWLGLLIPALIILGLTKPRLPQAPRGLRLFAWMGFAVFLLAIFVHGFLYPASAGLYILVKILGGFFFLPVICYKLYADYVAFRSSSGGSA